jgi:hypothetical protein
MSTEPAPQQPPDHFGELVKLDGEVFVKAYLDRRFSPTFPGCAGAAAAYA